MAQNCEPNAGKRLDDGASHEALLIEQIGTRVDDLERRLASEEKSRLKRFGAWCGVVALFVTILTGVLGLYDRFVLQPDRTKSAKEREASWELSQIVNRIAEINTEANRQPEVDETTQSEFLYHLGLEKKSLLDRANELVTKDRAHAGPNSFLVLSFEHIQLGNAEIALSYIEKVETLASDRRSLDDAKRYRAAAAYLPGHLRNLTNARELFNELVDAMRFSTDPHTNEYLMLVYSDWVQLESTYGECKYAQNQYVAMTEAAANRGLPSNSVDRTREKIRRHLGLTDCQIEIGD